MDVKYLVKGKYKGKEYIGSFCHDIQDCDDELCELMLDDDFSDLKQYIAYIHYEEIEERL